MINICHLCGENSELTLEHVPPRAAFNDKSDLHQEIFGRVRAKNTLCHMCNTTTGGWYGSAFADFVKQCKIAFDKSGNESYRHVYFTNIYPLRILKQIAVMIFSENGPSFREKNKHLAQFALYPEWGPGLPENHHIGISFSDYIFTNPIMSSSKLDGNVTFIDMSFSLPPLNYICTTNGVSKKVVDISRWGDYALDACQNLKLKIPIIEKINTLYYP